jgi:hypothetical protein
VLAGCVDAQGPLLDGVCKCGLGPASEGAVGFDGDDVDFAGARFLSTPTKQQEEEEEETLFLELFELPAAADGSSNSSKSLEIQKARS